MRLGSRVRVWGQQCCRICLLWLCCVWARQLAGSPWIPGKWDKLRADGCAQDEPSRLMTWAVLSAFLFTAAAVPVSEIGQIFILCAAPAHFSQSWHLSSVLSAWICIEQGMGLKETCGTESENQAGKTIRVQLCRVCDAFSSFDFFWVPFYCEWLVNFC